MACCSKARSVLPKLQVFGDQEHTDALLLFANILDIHIENQPQTFLQTCRRLADLHHKDPRSVEMLIPQLCGACVKLAAPAMHVLQSSFFVKRSAASLHFALLCSLSLLGMVQEPPLPRRASQSQELSAFSGTADATVQQRLMQLLHAICCASIARSKGMEERDGGLMLRDDRHFMSEARFAALVLAKGSSNGYGGLNFLDSVRQELQRSIDRARHDGGGGVEGGGSEMVAVGAWSAPAWMNKAMLQRLRVMCDTLWLLSQCVGFSEELRGVEDRPSRRARLSTLLQRVNGLLPQRTAYVPIAFSDAAFAIVTQMPEADAHVFSTKARVPYLAAIVQATQPKLCSDPFSSGISGALQSTGLFLSASVTAARGKVSSAADRMEDFVRSRRARSHSRDKHALAASTASDTMHEELLASTPLDDSEDTTAPAAAPALTTRQKKAASAPVAPSFDQLEDEVASAENAALMSAISSVQVTVGVDYNSDDDGGADASAAVVPEVDGERVQLVIFKSNDDLRQEMFAMQLIHTIRTAWADDGLDLYLREYRVLSTSPSSGLVEVVPDSSSIDALKKSNGCLSMARHFEHLFGAAGSAAHERALGAYISSLAGYSLLTYLLNIKDRHNGNILLQRDGHLVHIDFGFFFSIAPGGITFESAPFKLTRDFYELLGPNVVSNARYMKLVDMMTQGMISVRKHVARILTLVQHTFDIVGSGYPCFKLGQRAVDDLHARFLTEQPDAAMRQAVQGLLSQAWGNQRSTIYDYFQYKTNGILY